MKYPFTLPVLVQKQIASLMSLASAGSLFPVVRRQYRIVINDPTLKRKFVSGYYLDILSIPNSFLLDWVPGPRVRAWLLTTVWRGTLALSDAKVLDWRFEGLRSRVTIKNSVSEIRRLSNDSQASIHKRLKTARGIKVSGRTLSQPRPNPETRSITVRADEYEGSGTPWRGHNTTFITNYREWSGTRTPGFISLKKTGKLPVNPHHVFKYDLIDYGYIRAWVYPNPASCLFHCGPYFEKIGDGAPEYGSPIPTCQHIVSTRNRAITRLRGEIGEINNLAETFVQMNQATNMIGTNLMRIVNSVTALKRKNLSQAVHALWGSKRPVYRERYGQKSGISHTYTLSQNWIELQYGWKPLLNDIVGVIDGIAAIMAADHSMRSVYASAQNYETLSILLRPQVQAGLKAGVFGAKTIHTNTQYAFVIRYRISDKLKLFMSQVGFTNPISLAWELLPWSFVSDWVLPIGPFLESLTQWDGLEFYDGCETQFTRQSTFYRQFYEGNKPYGVPEQYVYTAAGGLKVEAIRLDRLKLTSFPTLSRPQLKNPLSITHAANALALIRLAFKR